MTRVAAAGIVLGLIGLYAGHVREATFVFEDDRSQYLTVADVPWQVALTTPRGLTAYSWTVIKTPPAAHALNLALHLLVVGLTGLVLWRTTGQAWVGVGGAAIMAVHPLTTETVAYAASRAELVSAIGALGALLVVTGPTIGWVGIPLCLWGAYLGKETGALAVPLIPVVLWMRRDARLEGALWVVGGALLVTSAIWVPTIPDWLTVGHTPQLRVDGVSWVVIQAAAVWRLVILSVWPAWLSVTPDIQPLIWQGIGSLVLLAALLECAWRARHRAPLFTLGVLWCAIVAAPRLVVRTPLSPFNEHQWYLALPGVACCLLAGIDVASAWIDARWRAWRIPCPA